MPTEIIEAMKAEMKRRDWSNRELARRVKVRPNTINTTLAGKRKPQRGTLVLLCRELGLDPDSGKKIGRPPRTAA